MITLGGLRSPVQWRDRGVCFEPFWLDSSVCARGWGVCATPGVRRGRRRSCRAAGGVCWAPRYGQASEVGRWIGRALWGRWVRAAGALHRRGQWVQLALPLWRSVVEGDDQAVELVEGDDQAVELVGRPLLDVFGRGGGVALDQAAAPGALRGPEDSPGVCRAGAGGWSSLAAVPGGPAPVCAVPWWEGVVPLPRGASASVVGAPRCGGASLGGEVCDAPRRGGW